MSPSSADLRGGVCPAGPVTREIGGAFVTCLCRAPEPPAAATAGPPRAEPGRARRSAFRPPRRVRCRNPTEKRTGWGNPTRSTSWTTRCCTRWRSTAGRRSAGSAPCWASPTRPSPAATGGCAPTAACGWSRSATRTGRARTGGRCGCAARPTRRTPSRGRWPAVPTRRGSGCCRAGRRSAARSGRAGPAGTRSRCSASCRVRPASWRSGRTRSCTATSAARGAG